MKYLKKSFAVLLIAAVLLGSASGCKKSGNESTGSDEYEWVTDVSEIVVSKDGNAANSGALIAIKILTGKITEYR